MRGHGLDSGCVCYAVTVSHFRTVKLNDRSVQSSEQRDCCQVLRNVVPCSRESRDRIDCEKREREREFESNFVPEWRRKYPLLLQSNR